MKKLKFLIMSLAALSVMSCSKEGVDGNVDTTPKSVFVKIGMESLATGDTPITGAATATDIKELNLFFLNGAEGVVFHQAINSTSVPTLTQLKAGYSFSNISGSALKVYIVANNTTNNKTDDIKDLLTLGEIKAKIRASESQNPVVTTDPSWKYVTMAGIGDITGTGTKTATVAIAPLMARMEIHKISTDASIESFTLAGIFINNHYKSITLGGAASGTISMYTTIADYVAANFKGYSDIAANMEKDPSKTSKCYGYQVVPAAIGATLPHIVLHLTSVKPKGFAMINKDQYVTVKSYKNGASALGAMNANNVYKIADLNFTIANIIDRPEAEDQDVSVKVTVTSWTVNNITGDL